MLDDKMKYADEDRDEWQCVFWPLLRYLWCVDETAVRSGSVIYVDNLRDKEDPH